MAVLDACQPVADTPEVIRHRIEHFAPGKLFRDAIDGTAKLRLDYRLFQQWVRQTYRSNRCSLASQTRGHKNEASKAEVGD
jgi:hypothetical protein